VGPRTGSLPGTPFVNLGQPAPVTPGALQQGPQGALQQGPQGALQQVPQGALQQVPQGALQQGPPEALQQGPPATPLIPQGDAQRVGKAIESRPKAASPPGSFNQFGPGPEGPSTPLKDSLGQALDEASKSVQFSLPPSDSPGPRPGAPPAVNRPRPGPASGFPQRQTLSGAARPGPASPSEPRPPPPGPDSFNQFRGSGDQAQITLQESLGQALDQASKSAQFSIPGGSSPGPVEGGASITRQGPGIPQGSAPSFPQRLDSPALQNSRPPQLSPRPGIPSSPQLGLEQALTKASEEAVRRPGPGGSAQLSNIGPVIPAVPSGSVESKPLLEEINLGRPSNPGSFRSSGSELFRGNTRNPSSPLISIRPSTSGSPSRAQSGPPRVFDATPGSGFDRQPFRSDPKISEQRITQSGEPASNKIFLGSTRVSESPRSSSLSSDSVRKIEKIPVKSCTKTFHEECHNEYKMVCEETFTERDAYECNIVEETKCEKGHTTEYEPACFQQILENCENICKRGIQPDCMPQCARSLGKTSCHKVKVVTPHTTCTKVPKEVCGNVKKRVPYEKCHDVPKKVCEQVPREVCK